MNMRESTFAFASFNPFVAFFFFCGAVICGFSFLHPAFLAVSFLASLLLLFTLKGREAFKDLYMTVPLCLAAVLINPLINTRGNTVLFSYFGRPFTLEAFLYGLAFAVLLASVLLWFASFNRIFSSDRLLYVLGFLSPGLSLLLVSSLRLVSAYTKRLRNIVQARRGAFGKAKGSFEKTAPKEAFDSFYALCAFALEDGIKLADSLQSRGYGLRKRGRYSPYPFALRDFILLLLLILSLLASCLAAAFGAAAVSYTPSLVFAPLCARSTLFALFAYSFFLLLPSLVNFSEEIKWRFLKSKI